MNKEYGLRDKNGIWIYGIWIYNLYNHVGAGNVDLCEDTFFIYSHAVNVLTQPILVGASLQLGEDVGHAAPPYYQSIIRIGSVGSWRWFFLRVGQCTRMATAEQFPYHMARPWKAKSVPINLRAK